MHYVYGNSLPMVCILFKIKLRHTTDPSGDIDKHTAKHKPRIIKILLIKIIHTK